MRLRWHEYKYFPYEKELALREVNALIKPTSLREDDGALYVDGVDTDGLLKRLVYFSAVSFEAVHTLTNQHLLESSKGKAARRQSTRYSAHGLHEYKGKFNPQIAKAVLNIFSLKAGQSVVDPFCGSGTSLVECAHLGIKAIGLDANPMAVFIANAKLDSLRHPAKELTEAAEEVIQKVGASRLVPDMTQARSQYLAEWFTQDLHIQIERFLNVAKKIDSPINNVLLAIASNLLREYSLQDPQDLRIRRRKDDLPTLPFAKAFQNASDAYAVRIADSQRSIGVLRTRCLAKVADSRNLRDSLRGRKFDAALTSPPYATALPYVDTQRLSLIWLGLLEPSRISDLDADLVGSREFRGVSKSKQINALQEDAAGLPLHELRFCRKLQAALAESDGFRRQRVPFLLYRYFAGMKDTFAQTIELMKPGAKYALVVGGNHTVLGGKRLEIDTPTHITSLATSVGWRHIETIALQTYHRFGLHQANSTKSEQLVILEA